MPRKLLFSVSIKDCKVETFTVPGPGGSGKDTSNTGVRITHRPSGAAGQSSDSRSQLSNKRAAFRRMAESAAFKAWTRLKAAEIATGKTIEERVDEELKEAKLKVERKTPLGWEVWKEVPAEKNPTLCRKCQHWPIATTDHGYPIKNEGKLCQSCLDWEAHQDYLRSPG